MCFQAHICVFQNSHHFKCSFQFSYIWSQNSIYSLNKYYLSMYIMPGIALDTEYKAVNKTNMVPLLILIGEMQYTTKIDT